MLSWDNADIVDTTACTNNHIQEPVFPIAFEKGCKSGKAGKEGALQITNTEFVTAVFSKLPDRAFAAICSKSGDPNSGGWSAMRARDAIDSLKATSNNFINCSSFYPRMDGSFKAKKLNFAACHFLMLDDLGTKVSLEKLSGIELSWLIETSPGNYQGGVLLDEPITDEELAQSLLNAVIKVDLCVLIGFKN